VNAIAPHADAPAGYLIDDPYPNREESTMASVSYNAREKRLVAEGPCWPEDTHSLVDAIGAFAAPGSGLVVDLTRVPYLPPEVALAIGDACRTAEHTGCRVRVWTDPETSTASRIAAAYTDRTAAAAH
jgi:hypothetical protein